MSKVVRVRAAPCFCQILVWGGPSSFLSFFLTFFFSFALPSRWLFWQALFEFSPHGSGQKSMPICVFSCSTLDWWRLGERKQDRCAKSRDSKRVHWLQTKYSSNCASVYQNNGRIIKWEMLSWLRFVFHSFLPQVPFLASDGWCEGRLVVESGGARIKDYYQRIQPDSFRPAFNDH